MSARERFYIEFLLMRGIDVEFSNDKPCDKCSGFGVRSYPDTSTWHRGVGGQTVTNDICDGCWGSGNREKPWTNLRQLKLANKD